LGAALQMVWVRTSVIPGRDPTQLLTGGLFGLSRNPIYLGDALLLAGLSLGWGALLALPLVPLFMALISKRFILPEEARLAALFGQDYEDYKNHTRRWI
ncbi:MAG: isoprenylcysteine carboxylmethyltransferase family protein, partial [Rhodobacteraceae bacterium]|nr:isoprenylcysteine carboxylmethyltransferase family protein [Paracoccaceae bacterium]